MSDQYGTRSNSTARKALSRPSQEPSSMRLSWLSSRQFQRRLLVSLVLSTLTIWFLLPARKHEVPPVDLEQQYPLLWRHVHNFNGTGGAWYIPPSWLPSADVQPDNIFDAALLASQATSASKNRQLDHSSIPLILHQTWKNRQVDTWSDLLRVSVEKWLRHIVADDMAYFFWEDDGMLLLLDEFEPKFAHLFRSLPSNVERADVFRVLVVKWFGGIYADVDTQPLQRPTSWIKPTDIAPWTDPKTGRQFASDKEVAIVLGIEADTDPNGSDWWRMGYDFPVQLTQWALASAPGHPVLLRFMQNLTETLDDVAVRNYGDIDSVEAVKELRHIGPLLLTGPVAVTLAAMSWLEQLSVRWNALTGLHDGGRSKLVDDVLVLPITGFSPGRGRYGNMGSKPVTDSSARLWHRAQGSWRRFDLKVEYGKVCRSVFGMCKDWSKQPD